MGSGGKKGQASNQGQGPRGIAMLGAMGLKGVGKEPSQWPLDVVRQVRACTPARLAVALHTVFSVKIQIGWACVAAAVVMLGSLFRLPLS
jgi:hypothetical protein